VRDEISFSLEKDGQTIASLGGHPNPANGGHLKTGQ
jgi:hypothetical protein